MKVCDFWDSSVTRGVAIWLEQSRWGTRAVGGDRVREVTVRQGQIVLGFLDHFKDFGFFLDEI